MFAVQERKTTKSPFHGVYLRKINTFDGKYGIIIVMIKIIPLFSGSKGNSTLIQTENTLLLLDVGYSYRATLEKFKALGISPKDVDAVVITHEHADHVSSHVDEKFSHQGVCAAGNGKLPHATLFLQRHCSS